MGFDIFQVVNDLGNERYRSIIIHAKPEYGQVMSKFAEKLSQKANGKYIDLLEYFIENSELSESIDTFGVEKLFSLLKEFSSDVDLLAIDRPDFLLDTWRKKERDNFFRVIDNQWDSFKEKMRTKIVFFLQTSIEIESLNIKGTNGQSKIYTLAEFNDIF
jgi:hypothetical protein